MDITSVNRPPTPVTDGTSGSASGVLSSDFEVFLKMLTAQAEYQDPLEPIDSSEYAAQLAQFSMVEQQVSTNTLLEQMMTVLAGNDMNAAANWIGLEALVAGPANFQGQPITIAPNPPIAADTVDLVVRNSDGTEVNRIALPVSADNYTWDGTDAEGNVLPYGEYSLSIQSSAAGEVIAEDAALTYTRVTEARLDQGSMLLVLQNGYLIAASDVVGLREPEPI
ncbi:MAG: flagellar hook capping FlgD N-terminal domain-containing protein [Pseudomonadota bacterium]